MNGRLCEVISPAGVHICILPVLLRQGIRSPIDRRRCVLHGVILIVASNTLTISRTSLMMQSLIDCDVPLWAHNIASSMDSTI